MDDFLITRLPQGEAREILREFLTKNEFPFEITSNMDKITGFVHAYEDSTTYRSSEVYIPETMAKFVSEKTGDPQRLASEGDRQVQSDAIGMNPSVIQRISTPRYPPLFAPYMVQGIASAEVTSLTFGGSTTRSDVGLHLLPPPQNAADALIALIESATHGGSHTNPPHPHQELNAPFSDRTNIETVVKEEVVNDGYEETEADEHLVKDEVMEDADGDSSGDREENSDDSEEEGREMDFEELFKDTSIFREFSLPGSPDGLYHCLMCDVDGFPTDDLLNEHVLIHPLCRRCGLRFPANIGLNWHKLRCQHNYRCDVCGKTFIRSGHLKTHKLTHTGEKFEGPKSSH